MGCVLAIRDGRLTCKDPERDLYPDWNRAATPILTPAEHLAQIKQKDAAFASLKSPFDTLQTTREAEKDTLQLRGLKGYVEPRIDYCSKAANSKPVRDGLIKYPSWERQDFPVLLKMWCVDSPRHRHSRAAYAFNPDGTPTSEYKKALTIFAEQRKDVVAAHSDEYVLKMSGETARNVLRPTTGPARSESVQKQQSSSQIQEDEEGEEEAEESEGENEEENDEEDTDEDKDTDEDEEVGNDWQSRCRRLKRRAKFYKVCKRRRESVQRGRGGLSPDPQRTVLEGKRRKCKGRS